MYLNNGVSQRSPRIAFELPRNIPKYIIFIFFIIQWKQMGFSQVSKPSQLNSTTRVKAASTLQQTKLKTLSKTSSQIKTSKKKKMTNTPQGWIEPVYIRPSEFSLSYENLSFKNSAKIADSMGLVGLNYRLKYLQVFSAGFTSFIASSGTHGGFLGLGVNGGYDLNFIPSLTFRSDLFLGGAGGVGVQSNYGGLMLRLSEVALLDLKYFKPGIGYARDYFPNGTINSSQLFFQASIPSDFIYTTFTPDSLSSNASSKAIPKDLKPIINTKNFDFHRWRLMPLLKSYFLQSGLLSLPKSGKTYKLSSSIALAGVSIEHFINQNLFTNFEIFGAFSGNVPGYSSVTVGTGYKLPITSVFSLAPGINIGGAGGGNVNTGGGLIIEPRARVIAALTSSVSAQAGVGYLSAPSGNFKALSGEAGIAYEFDALETKQKSNFFKSGVYPTLLNQSNWRISGSTVRYFLAQKRSKNLPNYNDNVDLFGFRLDYLLPYHFFLLGEAQIPYLGGASGFAAGLLGFGYEQSLIRNLSASIAAKVGPAAGGGLLYGKAFAVMGDLGLNWNWSPDFALFASGGPLYFLSGASSVQAEFGIRYSFGIPQKHQ